MQQYWWASFITWQCCLSSTFVHILCPFAIRFYFNAWISWACCAALSMQVILLHGNEFETKHLILHSIRVTNGFHVLLSTGWWKKNYSHTVHVPHVNVRVCSWHYQIAAWTKHNTIPSMGSGFHIANSSCTIGTIACKRNILFKFRASNFRNRYFTTMFALCRCCLADSN